MVFGAEFMLNKGGSVFWGTLNNIFWNKGVPF